MNINRLWYHRTQPNVIHYAVETPGLNVGVRRFCEPITTPWGKLLAAEFIRSGTRGQVILFSHWHPELYQELVDWVQVNELVAP